MKMSSGWRPMMQMAQQQSASYAAPVAPSSSARTAERGSYSAPSPSNLTWATTRLGTTTPPPPRPMGWGMVLGWATVVAMAAGIFWGVTQEGPLFSVRKNRSRKRRRGTGRRSSRLRANRRRSTRGLTRNGFTQKWPAKRINEMRGTQQEVYDFLVDYMKAYGRTRVGDITGYLGDWARPILMRLRGDKITIHSDGVITLGRPVGRNRRRVSRNGYYGTSAEAAMRRLTKRPKKRVVTIRGKKVRLGRNARKTTKRRTSAVNQAQGGAATVRNLGVSGAPAASKLGQKRYDMLVRRGAGLYRISAGRSPSVIKFGSSTGLQGAMTNTRIAASKSGESHWLVKVYPSGRPRAVVIRYITADGKTKFRVEEYAQAAFERLSGYGRRVG